MVRIFPQVSSPFPLHRQQIIPINVNTADGIPTPSPILSPVDMPCPLAEEGALGLLMLTLLVFVVRVVSFKTGVPGISINHVSASLSQVHNGRSGIFSAHLQFD